MEICKKKKPKGGGRGCKVLLLILLALSGCTINSNDLDARAALFQIAQELNQKIATQSVVITALSEKVNGQATPVPNPSDK